MELFAAKPSHVGGQTQLNDGSRFPLGFKLLGLVMDKTIKAGSSSRNDVFWSYTNYGILLVLLGVKEKERDREM